MMSDLVVPVSPHDHALGRADAELTLVEYGDIQCPHCALAHPVIHEIAEELRDSLRVVFRHFPLARIHPLAERGAEVVEAAAASGCFWEMLDLMYANHDDLSEDAFHRFVRKLKLDSRRVSRELHEGLYRDRVRADYLGGLRSGVQGTPTFFINGTRYAGAIDFDAMVVALLQASQKQK